jgi:hypothetical protein
LGDIIVLLSVKTYDEMLRKIAVYAFVVGAACATILRANVGSINEFAAIIDVQVPQGLIAALQLPTFALPTATLLVGLLAALLSHMFKLHDKISDLLRMRQDFDVRWILLPMAALSGASITPEKLDKVIAQRDRLMKDVFYKYASSTKPLIDTHAITSALTNWSWYWCALEACVYLTATSLILIAFGAWQPAAWMLLTSVALTIVMRLLRYDSGSTANAEIEEIMADETRRNEVAARFDAL